MLCIDRLIWEGKTVGYVYVLQAETKEYSDENTYHWDVSDHRLLLIVAGILEQQTTLSLTRLEMIGQ